MHKRIERSRLNIRVLRNVAAFELHQILAFGLRDETGTPTLSLESEAAIMIARVRSTSRKKERKKERKKGKKEAGSGKEEQAKREKINDDTMNDMILRYVYHFVVTVNILLYQPPRRLPR